MTQPTTFKPVLAVNQCSIHGWLGVFIGTYEPDCSVQGSTRLTPSKCCGRWDRDLKYWVLSRSDLVAIIEEATALLDQMKVEP